MKTAIKHPSLCRPVGSTPCPNPVNMPEKISIIAERPYPLYPSVPPKGSSGPPALNAAGSVVARPSLSTIQPSGILFPLAKARFILPAATAEDAISIKKGPSRSDGIAIEIGFVPRRFSLPPNGATALGPRPESAVIRAIIPSFAAING